MIHSVASLFDVRIRISVFRYMEQIANVERRRRVREADGSGHTTVPSLFYKLEEARDIRGENLRANRNAKMNLLK